MISVHEAEKLSLQEIERFLLAAKGVRFEASQREEIYGWVERLLCQQEYARQGRRVRGLLRRYLGKMTGRAERNLRAWWAATWQPGEYGSEPADAIVSPLATPGQISNCWHRSMKPMRP